MMQTIQVAPPRSLSKCNLTDLKRVALPVLGCKVNAFESELLGEKLISDKYLRVKPTDWADLYIINTCTVTAEADRQARQMVRKAIKTNPTAKIVVTGCYAEIDPNACMQIPGVDLVVGNSQKLSIPSLLTDLEAIDSPQLVMRDIDQEISLPDQLIHGFHGKSRAFVQIQQGCDQGCTFCIIHKARGPNRSFPPEMIRRQCERLILNGYREIVLCGVDVGSYAKDQPKWGNLTDLIHHVFEIPRDFRLRLSSIDPVHITDAFIQLFSIQDRFCPQLHLSLQSANTLILKRMKRRAHRELIYENIAKLRKACANLVLSADIMVGFPTETEAQFCDTLNAIRDLQIAYPHVFCYSARKGTPAARIPRQVPIAIRKSRSRQARDLGKAVWHQVAKKQIGRTMRVLVEQVVPNSSDRIGQENFNISVIARADNYFPVIVGAEMAKEGDWMEVEIIGILNDKLMAKMIAWNHLPILA